MRAALLRDTMLCVGKATSSMPKKAWAGGRSTPYGHANLWGLDFEAMRRAIERLDAGALVGLYADDAQIRVVNKNTTPSSPFELRGKEAIAEYLRDVCGRATTHRIEGEVVGEERVAFNEACEYPDGTRVLAASTLDLRDGKIVRQVNVEAWDE